MCGIFSFTGPGEPDPVLYNELGRLAGRRGPHGHGWYTVEDGLFRAPGPLQEVPKNVYGGIIGHSRLSTMGDYGDAGIQPVLTKGADVVVHNGNVYNWTLLDPKAATDSFAIGALYSQNRDEGMAPVLALQDVIDRCEVTASAIVLWDRIGDVLMWRRKLPIFGYADPSGLYLSSGQFPGSNLIREDTVLVNSKFER